MPGDNLWQCEHESRKWRLFYSLGGSRENKGGVGKIKKFMSDGREGKESMEIHCTGDN